MQIHKGLEHFERLPKAIVTTGTFDGVHLGHQKLLKILSNRASLINSETVVVTFFPHPRNVLFPDHELKLINTIDENISLFKRYNVDHLVLQNFDINFSRITSLEYIRDFLCKKIGLKELVVGYNHQFGRNREGSKENLEEYSDLYDFTIHEVQPYYFKETAISSTKIRNGILNGDFELVNQYLGYDFKLSGTVIRGKGLGKSTGFPTANILVENKNKIIPRNGVYAVNINYNNTLYKGMLNIGVQPTFNQKKLSIEVHIFDFSKDIYDQFLTIEFIKRIRNEKKFDSIDLLKDQLFMDKIAALNILD